MATIIRAIGYTGNLQRLTIPEGFAADLTVYAWGGGGGGSGGDSGGARRGGNGGGAGYTEKTLTVVPGDVLDIAIGQGGGVGGGATQGGGGSAGGYSLKLPQLQYTVGGSSSVTFDILTIGSGGGGGGGSSRALSWSGSGGGAGAVQRNNVTVAPGDRIGITVALGGAAGSPRDGPFSSGAPGSSGNTSTVLINEIVVTSALGGGGGSQASGSQPAVGAGGVGGVGTQVVGSTPGTSSNTNTGGTGGRGYVATDAADTVTYGNAGAGGIGQTSTPGQTGTVYGGGGGGGGGNSANDLAGDVPAAGGSGLVVISYTTLDGVPVFSGGTITIVGLRVTHTFSTPGSEVAYNGGSGGASVNNAYSGAGGGGGGATLILLNGTIVGYAGGGGGGGGCGNTLGAGSDAPGPNGQSGSATAGSNGQTSGVGGGGGGGAGGNGGAGNPSEGLAQAGAFGLRLGDVTQAPNARQPGGTNTPYYAGSAGIGGIGQTLSNGGGQPGTSGYAVVVMTPRSLFVKDGGNWNPINAIYARTSTGWARVKAVFVKQANVWTPVVGANNDYAPTFSNVPSNFGTIPRPYGS